MVVPGEGGVGVGPEVADVPEVPAEAGLVVGVEEGEVCAEAGWVCGWR